jgi:hypothetical protein
MICRILFERDFLVYTLELICFFFIFFFFFPFWLELYAPAQQLIMFALSLF